MKSYIRLICIAALGIAVASACLASTAADLRLIPFPKQVKLAEGQFAVTSGMTISATDSPVSRRMATDLKNEIARVATQLCPVEPMPARNEQPKWLLWISTANPSLDELRTALGTLPTQSESYALAVTPGFAVVGAQSEAGLGWGAQTLRQLVRANMDHGAIPCLGIVDWPSLRYRGFQDDITRTRSSRLETMQREVRIGSLLKQNFFTYYMEYQFAFAKHPEIGPIGGSFNPWELKILNDYAKPYNLELIGSQQSFAHFSHILALPEYSDLKEGDDCLDPTNEKTYALLDDLYSEVAPVVDSPFFNVSCDETQELGTGPSKPLADKIGVGGVYAQHMKRVHDLVVNKYGKRMMMWGDIISRHPESLKEIPKDTIMLSWGYSPSPSFEKAIKPFAESGYVFFVCPGTSSWSRLLPNYGAATINIQNYTRDGVRLGAMGMLNTTWNDSGEVFQAANWHGIAWGAECAWNASQTSITDFNRRLGAVLFGEKSNHFGQAIELLTKASSGSSSYSMRDGRFWRSDLGSLSGDKATAIKQAKDLLALVEPALEHLRLAKADATANAELLDYLVFAADKVKLSATRQLDYLQAAALYQQARQSAGEPAKAEAPLQQCIALLSRNRDQHAASRTQYEALWLRENRPYALDRILARYDAQIAGYARKIADLSQAKAVLSATKALPAPTEIGLAIAENQRRSGGRRRVAQ